MSSAGGAAMPVPADFSSLWLELSVIAASDGAELTTKQQRLIDVVDQLNTRYRDDIAAAVTRANSEVATVTQLKNKAIDSARAETDRAREEKKLLTAERDDQLQKLAQEASDRESLATRQAQSAQHDALRRLKKQWDTFLNLKLEEFGAEAGDLPKESEDAVTQPSTEELTATLETLQNSFDDLSELWEKEVAKTSALEAELRVSREKEGIGAAEDVATKNVLTSSVQSLEEVVRKEQANALKSHCQKNKAEAEVKKSKDALAESSRTLEAIRKKLADEQAASTKQRALIKPLSDRLDAAERRMTEVLVEKERAVKSQSELATQLHDSQNAYAELLQRVNDNGFSRKELVETHEAVVRDILAQRKQLANRLSAEEQRVRELSQEAERGANLLAANQSLSKRLLIAERDASEVQARYAEEVRAKVEETVRGLKRDEESKSKKGRQRDELRAALQQREAELAEARKIHAATVKELNDATSMVHATQDALRNRASLRGELPSAQSLDAMERAELTRLRAERAQNDITTAIVAAQIPPSLGGKRKTRDELVGTVVEMHSINKTLAEECVKGRLAYNMFKAIMRSVVIEVNTAEIFRATAIENRPVEELLHECCTRLKYGELVLGGMIGQIKDNTDRLAATAVQHHPDDLEQEVEVSSTDFSDPSTDESSSASLPTLAEALRLILQEGRERRLRDAGLNDKDDHMHATMLIFGLRTALRGDLFTRLVDADLTSKPSAVFGVDSEVVLPNPQATEPPATSNPDQGLQPFPKPSPPDNTDAEPAPPGSSASNPQTLADAAPGAAPPGLPAAPPGLPAAPPALPAAPSELPSASPGLPAAPLGLPAAPPGLPATAPSAPDSGAETEGVSAPIPET